MIKKEMHRLFEDQVDKTPEHVAVVFANERLTYAALNTRANQVAGLLRKRRLEEGGVVGVAFDTGIDMVASILGVLKAGGVYLPLDPQTPGARAAYILRHSGAACLLTHSRYAGNFEFGGEILALDEAEPDTDEGGNLDASNGAARPFAITYGSNCTGYPQGVPLSQDGIANLVEFNQEKLKVNFSNTLYVTSHDAAMTFPAWLIALLAGGTVYFYAQEDEHDLAGLSELVRDAKISAMVLPLTLLGRMGHNSGFKQVFTNGLRNIISVGDEVLEVGELRSYLKERNIRWHNYLGFPEVQIVTSLIEESSNGSTETKHIGRPVSNTHAFVITGAKELVPVGVAEELYVSGAGVMEGYFRNNELNLKQCVENPFLPGTKMFQTGYKASWQPDGVLAFHGRTDNKISIGGQLIALEEVEAVLAQHGAVEECAVVAVKTDEGNARLAAYVVLNEVVSVEQLEEHLKRFLPQRIFPLGFVQVAALRRNAEGEVDRKWLQELGFLDTVQIRDLEQRLENEPAVEKAVVLVRENLDTPPVLHLKKHIPEFKMKRQSEAIVTGVKSEDKRPEQGSERPPSISYGGDLQDENSYPLTLVEAFRRTVEQNGDEGIVYIQRDGSAVEQSYRELAGAAERVMGGLRSAGVKAGEKVILQLEENEEFVVGFWGCVLGGFVPVPLAVPATYEQVNNATSTLHNVWEMLEQPVVMTSREREAEVVRLGEGWGTGKWRVLSVEGLREGDGGGGEWQESQEDEMALMLFTSGSTGTPKGVVLTHRNI
ncbi:MAG TPA: AMP-binding protein, partial [Pyrinomonadaceae bacterium]|nr:AMP-binding protein [Pyrinomonadaceae bacterium]